MRQIECLGNGCVQDNYGCCYIVFIICPYKAVPVYKMLLRKFWFGGFRRGSRGGFGMGVWTPLDFSKYTSRRTTFNISRFSALSGVFLYAHFKILRLASLACYSYLIRMKVYLCHVTILRQFCLLSRNLKVIFACHILSASLQNNHPLDVFQYTPILLWKCQSTYACIHCI